MVRQICIKRRPSPTAIALRVAAVKVDLIPFEVAKGFADNALYRESL